MPAHIGVRDLFKAMQQANEANRFLADAQKTSVENLTSSQRNALNIAIRSKDNGGSGKFSATMFKERMISQRQFEFDSYAMARTFLDRCDPATVGGRIKVDAADWTLNLRPGGTTDVRLQEIFFTLRDPAVLFIMRNSDHSALKRIEYSKVVGTRKQKSFKEVETFKKNMSPMLHGLTGLTKPPARMDVHEWTIIWSAA